MAGRAHIFESLFCGAALICGLLFWSAPAWADDLTHAQCVEDLRYLAQALEETHPDPYRAFGGAEQFSARVQSLISRVPEDGMSAEGLYRLLRPFLAQFGDLHTWISSPENGDDAAPERYLPVWFEVAADEIFVSRTKEGFDDLLGARLRAVDGVSIDTLQSICDAVWPAENEFGSRRTLSRMIRYHSSLPELIGQAPDTLGLTLVNADGSTTERRLPLLESAEYRERRWRPDSSALRIETGRELSATFLGDAGAVAYFWLPHMSGREAFEIMRASGVADLEERLDRFYQNDPQRERPADLAAAIEGVPSLVEALRDLLLDMRERESTHLIVDLRDNGGGWSATIPPLLYLLYGDRYFAQEFPVEWRFRISQNYLNKFSTTLEEFNQDRNSDIALGEIYTKRDDRPASAVDRRERYLDELRADSLGFVRYLEALDGNSLYEPQVIVLTSTKTGSSAFHLLYYLWRMGARVVGVTPSQAANSFMDSTPLSLPQSGLRFQVSHSALVMFPDDTARGRAFTPDFPLFWTDFQTHNFDPNAPVLRTLELIRTGEL